MCARRKKLCGVPISNNFETNVKTSSVDGRSDRRTEKENREERTFKNREKGKRGRKERERNLSYFEKGRLQHIYIYINMYNKSIILA